MVDRERFITKLTEQLTLLEISAQNYDRGIEIEGYRIATAMRNIFSTGGGTPLIRYLGMEDWDILTTSLFSDNHFTYIETRFDFSSATPVRAVPRLGDKVGENLFPTSIARWWDDQKVYSNKERSYTRRQLILDAANTDGGTHIHRNWPPSIARSAKVHRAYP